LFATIIVMGSLDPMIFTGLAVVSEAIAAYNLYKIIEEENEEELRREAAQARREAAAQARREAAQAIQARESSEEAPEVGLAEKVPDMTQDQLNELFL
jgi:hypothetical protein